MRVGLFVCAALAACAFSSSAQDQPKKKSDGEKPVILVTGCVDGSWLRVQAGDAIGSYAERYRLRGSKQLLKELTQQYNGHLLEVTGAVTDTGNTTHRGKTIQVGKSTRIYTGAKEIPNAPTGSGDPTLEVGSFRELKASCS